MNTFIIMWNPDAPELNYERFKVWFYDPLDSDIQVELTDWKRARVGDRFFMVRAGDKGRGSKGNGIVMSGFIISEPFVPDYKFTDGEKRHCVDVQPDYMFDTNRIQTLTDDFLTEHLPEFDWKHGPSGKVLDKAVAARLEELWGQCLLANADSLKNGRKWRTAQDVFKKGQTIALYQLHGQGDIIGVTAEFFGGGIDVVHFEIPYYGIPMAELPEMEGRDRIISVPNFSVEITSLRKALRVKDDYGVVARLRKDYTGIDGMKRLYDFVKKVGCLYDEIDVLD